MSNRRVTTWILFCLAGVPALLAAQEPAAAPVLRFESTTWDFGELVQGERSAHIFFYENAGSAPLELLDVNASCGCTIPSFSRDPLAPGERGRIKVIFDSRDREGPQKKALSVRTNDPHQKRLTLIVKGTVSAPPAPEIQCSVHRIDFGILEEGVTLSREVTVRNAGEEDLVIEQIEGSVPELRARVLVDGPIAPGEEATAVISIRGAGTVPVRAFDLRLEITSNDPIQSEIVIVCLGYRKTPPQAHLVMPEEPIDVGIVDTEDVKLLDLPILNDGEASLRIVAVKTPGVCVEIAGAEGLEIPPGGLASIEVRSAKRLRKGTHVHRILLVFEDRGTGQRHPQELLLSGYFTRDTPR